MSRMLPPEYFRLSDNQSLRLYERIQENLIELIENNLLKVGDMLPSERALSQYYGVNRMTVRQAIDNLVRKGFLQRRQGVGNLVSERRVVQPFTPTVIGFSQRMREAGLTPSSRVLQQSVVTPEPIVAHRLGLHSDHQVVMIKRLRLVNDEPLMVETSYLSYDLFPRLLSEDLENQSLYQVLERLYDVRISEAEHTLEPTLTTPYEALHLRVESGTPAMLVRLLAYSANRTPIEFSKALVRGDRCRYYFRVTTHVPIVT
ncbi:MAG: GntR family transcriptional regulator [Aggregatilineales bacterium]